MVLIIEKPLKGSMGNIGTEGLSDYSRN